MADKMFENNQVSIIGEIVSDFQFSHEVYGEGFYMMEVSVRRLSDCMERRKTVSNPIRHICFTVIIR